MGGEYESLSSSWDSSTIFSSAALSSSIFRQIFRKSSGIPTCQIAVLSESMRFKATDACRIHIAAQIAGRERIGRHSERSLGELSANTFSRVYSNDREPCQTSAIGKPILGQPVSTLPAACHWSVNASYDDHHESKVPKSLPVSLGKAFTIVRK